MSSFDEFGESIANMAKEVGDKAKELSEVARIHANIKAEELKIQDLYYKLGKKYYESYKDTPDLDVEDFVDRIKKSNEKIDEYREDLESAKNAKEGTYTSASDTAACNTEDEQDASVDAGQE